MNVAVVGTGYVGLVAGTCFAELGHKVVCVDNDQSKLTKLRAGKLPIYEPGLEEMVPRNVNRGRLVFTDDLAGAVKASEVVFIAVGTPPGEDGSADLRYVLAVADAIGKALDGFKVIVMKSTVPIGTCDRIRETISGLTTEPFAVVSNPEFLREGVAVEDFMRPERIVVGTNDERAIEVMRRLYRPLTADGAKLLLMDVRSSEMTKYASNSMLATRISFMNEIANLCEKLGADVENVRRGMGSDSRIGPHFLKAGVGYGGSCFPKDVAALIQTARENGSEVGILKAAVETNERQKVKLVEVIKGDLGESLAGKKIAVWGLAFKPQTDDMREAPSIPLCEALVAAGAEVVAYDPEARHTARVELGDSIVYAEDPYRGLEGADALCLVTEWKEFTAPDWERMWALMRDHFVYDGRNLWEPREVAAQGFKYRGIGRR
ncbi:MAG TPA: UDP-glucose/GDP-mannose dehydrogenase family protein [Myxococcota bacterium]|nr:UDP-glucose/GDP-mannose dehydrogenase family protein [Myxococcota bacterium]